MENQNGFHSLYGETMTYWEFRNWLRAHRQADGCVRAAIVDCTITDIPKDETVFESLDIQVEKKIWWWTVKKLVHLTMCAGIPLMGSYVTRCVFKAEGQE